MGGWRKKQIADLQAGADIHAGDGGYSIGNAEDHAAFKARRNKSMMNARIRDFERQSGLDIYGLGKDRAKWESALEKFTQLIVLECAHLTDTLNDAYGAPSTTGKFIKEHFGVEE